MTNYDIKSLIPQCEPILLVDALVGVEGDMAWTQLTVRRDNSFVGDDGLLAEPGLSSISPSRPPCAQATWTAAAAKRCGWDISGP